MKTSPLFLVLSIAAASASTQQSTPSLLLVGPVEQVKELSGVVTVLGKNVQTNLASELKVGELVEVYGVIGSNGDVTDASVTVKGEYIPGVSTVLAKGVVTGTQPAIGSFTLGSEIVDYTALLSNQDFSGVTAGDVVEVAGIQPLSGGTILANVVESSNIIATTSSPLPTYVGSASSTSVAAGESDSSQTELSTAYAHGGGTEYAHGGGTEYAHGGGTEYAHGGGTEYAHGGGTL